MITLTDETALNMLSVFLYAEDNDLYSIEQQSIYLAHETVIQQLRKLRGKQIEITIKVIKDNSDE